MSVLVITKIDEIVFLPNTCTEKPLFFFKITSLSQLYNYLFVSYTYSVFNEHFVINSTELIWWRWWDSNPWPPACRAGALPAELHPHFIGFCCFLHLAIHIIVNLVGPSGLEPPWKTYLSLHSRKAAYAFSTIFEPLLVLLVGPSGLEPPTSCLSGTRSNLLSYEPMWLVWIFIHTWSFVDLRKADLSALLSQCQHWAIFPYSLP